MTATPPVGQSFFGLTINMSGLVDRLLSFRRSISKRLLLLEFGTTSLTFAEAKYTGLDVEFKHLKRVSLPANAIERGVPSEPDKMAALIQSICKEENIYAQRTVVVLPPEAVFTTSIDIPAELSQLQAWDYVKNPKSGLQIPIPLQQTDFDILPINLPLLSRHKANTKPYLLMSVPQKLIDKLLDTLEAAELELQAVEIGSVAQLRLIAGALDLLKQNEICLMLELLPECTHLTVIATSGPVSLLRLAAIREFPEPEVANNQIAVNASLAEHDSAEAITLADESYLPISEMDLRVLISELRRFMKEFSEKAPESICKSIYLTGVNSGHPKIDKLLSSALDLPVEVIRPLGAEGVGNVLFSQPLLHQSLGRLLGSGLTILPKDNTEYLSFNDYEQQEPVEEESDLGKALITATESPPIKDEKENARAGTYENIVDIEAEGMVKVTLAGELLENLEAEEVIDKQPEEEKWPSVHGDALLAEHPAKDKDAVEEEKLVIAELAEKATEQKQAVKAQEVVDAGVVAELVEEQEEGKLVLEEADEQEEEEPTIDQQQQEEEWPSIHQNALLAEQPAHEEDPLEEEKLVIAELGEKATEQEQAIETKKVINADVAAEFVAEQQEGKLVLEEANVQEEEPAIDQQQQEEEWPSIHQNALLAEQPAHEEDPLEEEKLVIAELGEKATEKEQAVETKKVINADVAAEFGEEQSEQKLVLEEADELEEKEEEKWPSIHQNALLAEQSAHEEDPLEEEKLVIAGLGESKVEQDQDQHSEKTTEANDSEEAIAEQDEFPLGELKFSGDDP
ncbi:Competence protein A [Prochlorococcus marinus str. MIT 1318]|uniref:pilus assembly protein PilM n=1 Tax=Prochlorococcus TaxID=1218 RepID=UPI0007B38DEE|nr:pilus assembly protein PilM [Prochlorococcus marinus]KZR71025.1 Competence protein A [Prochlorococcus marinus str. MIT 1318]